MNKEELIKFKKDLSMNTIINTIGSLRFNNIKKLGIDLQKYISRLKNKHKIILNKPTYTNDYDNKPTELELLYMNSKLDIFYSNVIKTTNINIIINKTTNKNQHTFLKHFNIIYNNMRYTNINNKDNLNENINTDYVIKNDYSSNLMYNYILEELTRLIDYNQDKHDKNAIINYILSIIIISFNDINYDVIFNNNELLHQQQLFFIETSRILSENIKYQITDDYYGTDVDINELTEEELNDFEEKEKENYEISNIENNDFYEDNEKDTINE